MENSKARPGSARVRPQSGLPLSHVPKWISQDKKVLSFEAYFKETVYESRLEHYRVRRCVIQYFLEDDTIKISEPREENSGMPQGNFLKRGKVVQEGIGGGFVTWRDLKIPGDLSLYGRVFRVTKCDDFTAEFYTTRGYEVGSEEAVPMDPVHVAKARPASSHTVVSIGRDGEKSSFHGRMKNDMTDFIEARLGRCQVTICNSEATLPTLASRFPGFLALLRHRKSPSSALLVRTLRHKGRPGFLLTIFLAPGAGHQGPRHQVPCKRPKGAALLCALE